MTLSLGTLTDLAVLRLAGAEITEHADHLVVGSPHNPFFYWGNYIQLLDGAGAHDVERWVATFERSFPEARHRTFGLPDASASASWAGAGFTVEAEETLVAVDPRTPPAPLGYGVRPLRGGDWSAYVALELADNERTGVHDPELHADYLARQVTSRQRLIEAGVAEFFGAFHPAEGLVADLGIVRCPPLLGESGLARFQHVFTAPDHRNRGLASHLVGVAARWASERGSTRFVICTETTNAAGRVYRAAGFTPAAEAWGAEKLP